MKKREIHKGDFMIARIVVLLEIVLRGDQRFLSHIVGSRCGRIDSFDFPQGFHGEEAATYFKVKPQWWPEGSWLAIDIRRGGKIFSDALLWVPQIPEFGITPLRLSLISRPPFFEPRFWSGESGILFFMGLCKEVYGGAAAV